MCCKLNLGVPILKYSKMGRAFASHSFIFRQLSFSKKSIEIPKNERSFNNRSIPYALRIEIIYVYFLAKLVFVTNGAFTTLALTALSLMLISISEPNSANSGLT